MMFLSLYGFSLHTLSCILLGQVLLFAAMYDLATHTVPDCVHILILLIGLIEIQVIPAILGLLLVPLPLLAAALFEDGSIGGADIKLMGACGFVLGFYRGYLALTAGLFTAVLIQSVWGEKDRPFALVPYLAFGCCLALISIT